MIREDTVVEDLDLDSLAMLEWICDLEDHFGISIEEVDFVDLIDERPLSDLLDDIDRWRGYGNAKSS